MAITQVISVIPTPPTMADAENFDERAEIFLNALPALSDELNAFGTQANAVVTGVNSASTTATTAAATATTKAGEASTSATNAATSESNALASKNSAAASATTATTKAGEASTSATSASGSATTATTKAGEASTSAASALSSKNAAATSETNALASKNAAETAATTATTKAGESSTSATSASTSATTATTKAGEASTSAAAALSSKNSAETAATTATTKASEANTSAIAAAASAASAADIALGNIPNATADIAGKIELATTAEVQAGTDNTRAVTASGAAATYALIANGVTNGDAHDHTGGDGGTIAYSSLSGTPTIPSASSTAPSDLGTAAVGSGTTFARADHVHTMPTAANVGAMSTSHAANGITGLASAEPAAVSSSTSGAIGTSTLMARQDHGHDLSAHAHTGATDGGQVSYTALSNQPTIPTTASQVGSLASGADINLADYKVQRPYFQDWAEVVNARGSISGAQTIDLELGNVVTATITGATTFTFSNPPATGRAGGFVLVLTNGGAGTITWPTSCKGLPTTPLTASGIDQLAFLTVDGGTTYNCTYKLDVK